MRTLRNQISNGYKELKSLREKIYQTINETPLSETTEPFAARNVDLKNRLKCALEGTKGFKFEKKSREFVGEMITCFLNYSVETYEGENLSFRDMIYESFDLNALLFPNDVVRDPDNDFSKREIPTDPSVITKNLLQKFPFAKDYDFSFLSEDEDSPNEEKSNAKLENDLFSGQKDFIIEDYPKVAEIDDLVVTKTPMKPSTTEETMRTPSKNKGFCDGEKDFFRNIEDIPFKEGEKTPVVSIKCMDPIFLPSSADKTIEHILNEVGDLCRETCRVTKLGFDQGGFDPMIKAKGKNPDKHRDLDPVLGAAHVLQYGFFGLREKYRDLFLNVLFRACGLSETAIKSLLEKKPSWGSLLIFCLSTLIVLFCLAIFYIRRHFPKFKNLFVEYMKNFNDETDANMDFVNGHVDFGEEEEENYSNWEDKLNFDEQFDHKNILPFIEFLAANPEKSGFVDFLYADQHDATLKMFCQYVIEFSYVFSLHVALRTGNANLHWNALRGILYILANSEHPKYTKSIYMALVSYLYEWQNINVNNF